MTDTPTLPLAVDGKRLRAPRCTPPRGPGRPSWSDHDPKTRKQCDHCAQRALETLQAGNGFEGIRQARRVRRHAGVSLLLCHEHARLQREQDDIDYPVRQQKQQTTRGGRCVLS